MRVANTPIVLGFDVGETLLMYAGTALSWVDHYPAAVAAICEVTLDRALPSRGAAVQADSYRLSALN
jgi:hypothetical protein